MGLFNASQRTSFPITCPDCGHEFVVQKSDLADLVLGAGVSKLTFPQICPKCYKETGTWTATEPPTGHSQLLLTYKGTRRADHWVVTIYTKRQ